MSVPSLYIEGSAASMLDFFRHNYKAIIWVMIICFLLSLVPSVFFFIR